MVPNKERMRQNNDGEAPRTDHSLLDVFAEQAIASWDRERDEDWQATLREWNKAVADGRVKPFHIPLSFEDA
jgi:predicted transcriptional regulator